MDRDATWYKGRPRPRPHCVRWRPSSPLLKSGTVAHFSAHIYCGQTAGWTEMPLGTKVGLGPHCVTWGPSDLPPPSRRKGTEPPIFGLCLLWPNGRPSQRLLSSCLANALSTSSGIGQCSRWHCSKRSASSRPSIMAESEDVMPTRRADNNSHRPVTNLETPYSQCGGKLHVDAMFMAALCNRGAIIFLPCSFFQSIFYLLSSFFLSSPNLSGRRLDVYHTSTHGVALVRI